MSAGNSDSDQVDGCLAIGAVALLVTLLAALLYLAGPWRTAELAQPDLEPQPDAETEPLDVSAAGALAPPLVATQPLQDTPTPIASPTPLPSATPTATFALTPTRSAPSFASSGYPLSVDEDQVQAILAQMTLEEKVAQMLMVGLPESYVDDVARRRVVELGVGGIIFLERNTDSAQQVAEFTQTLQAAAQSREPALPLLIGWNHEGGPVVRTNAQMTAFPSAMALGVANRPHLVYQIGEAVGQEMRSLGVNVNFAPVLDVNSEPANPVIGLRAYGDDPSLVAELGRYYLMGQQSAGIIAVAKHFPGHGDVNVDSHVDLPHLEAPLDVLQRRELPPFQVALDTAVGSVMVAHLQIPALEPDGWPSSLSPRIVNDLLRRQMGFDGVVMTDDMGMGSITNNFSLEQAAVQAVLAGNDLLLSVETGSYPERMQAALLNAVASGELSEQRIDQSVRRIIRLKLAYDIGGQPSGAPLAGQAEHVQIAEQAGRAAVRVLRDEPGWLPLPDDVRSILLVSPSTTNAGSTTGDSLSLLAEMLQERGLEVTETFYIPDAPWSVAEAQTEALTIAPSVDAIIVLTWNAVLRYAHFQDLSQEALVSRLMESGQPTIVVYSQLPGDAQRLGQSPTQIATYGDTVGQIEGLVAILLGE